MNTNPTDRSKVIETYEWLGYVISDNWRGRATDAQMKAAYREYVLACQAIHEPHFILADINSDDMAAIPHDYPQVKPDLPSIADYYDTPKTRARDRRVQDFVLDGQAVKNLIELESLRVKVVQTAKIYPVWRKKLMEELAKLESEAGK
jgi:hypothetical protein